MNLIFLPIIMHLAFPEYHNNEELIGREIAKHCSILNKDDPTGYKYCYDQQLAGVKASIDLAKTSNIYMEKSYRKCQPVWLNQIDTDWAMFYNCFKTNIEAEELLKR